MISWEAKVRKSARAQAERKNICSLFLSIHGGSIVCNRHSFALGYQYRRHGFALGYLYSPLRVFLDLSWPTWRFASACNSSCLLARAGRCRYLLGFSFYLAWNNSEV